MKFRGKSEMMMMVMIGMMVKINEKELNLYVGLKKIGVINRYFDIREKLLIQVLGILMFMKLFREMKEDIISEERIEGMQEEGIVMRVIVKNEWNEIKELQILQVVVKWKDMLWKMIVVKGMEREKKKIGIIYLRDEEEGDD